VFIVIGETVADLIEQPDGALLPVPGGSPANTAFALGRLARPTEFLGRLAPDTFGRRARARLVEAGVDVSGCVDAAEPSTLAVVTTDERGHPSYDFWVIGTADWQWTDDELAAHPRPGAAVVHTASIAAWTPPGDAAIAGLLERAAAAGLLVSFDPNMRPALVGPTAPTAIDRLLRLAHVVKVSDEDLAFLHPDRDPVDVAAAWLTLGPAVVVVTFGPDGAVALRSGREAVRVPAPVVAVVDTVGAGDTFTAGLLTGLVDVLDATTSGASVRDRLLRLDDDALAAVLRRAAVAAAINCTRAGCRPPDEAELTAALTAGNA
jgi:fructokinase